eukprot:gnl/MRDRNA2_/MRDRNA2_92598_c0_seq1.p1 gnl/MRDRNA2_/MRDRNA2_92598_c0~~gnl/MRDRNA2_/MRDRNA2_92598_c0_seq1.p1  ORF type:complete len:791 (+),score=149.74 gnl/MRDRNA2_/MRDRNA2_92598_c0_seq1:62-2434(+)
MTPEDFETYGYQVVEEIVRSWTSTYQFHIARLDPEANSASQACRYQVAFSLPLNAVPVPCDVLRVVFSLVIGEKPVVAFNLESSDLEQYWALHKDSQTNCWRPVPGQQLISLGFESFESFIESKLSEKDGVRTALDLRTPFEESRLLPPPAYSDSEDNEEGDDWDEEGSQMQDHLLTANITVDNADRQLMRSALQAAGLPYEGNLSLPDILASIFDAADETSCGLLHHHEVMQLLTSTLSGLGLELWDIHLLTASAQENAEGLIEYKAFVQAAPEIIEALQFRRLAYKKAGFPKAVVTAEAVQICHGDEIAETVRTLTELFEQCADPSLEGLMTRSCFKDCLACRHDRISPQELQHLMQMMPEDEDGRVTYADLQEQLEMLRVDSLHNALVETDVPSLRKHIILLLRRQGLNADCTMHLWNLKRVLLQADQLCLSRLQIHVILCMTPANVKGLVNCHEFLQVCCAVIPHMFSSELFVDFAANVADEAAAATKRAELAELEAMTKGMTAAAGAEEDQAPAGEEVVAEVDREQVEKSLTHAFSLLDDGRKGVLSAETIHRVLTSADAQVQSCQLSEAELLGLAAEMSLDQNADVAYKEHVQTWVPILFELRKSRLYETYLVREPFKDIKKPDLTELEKEFPVLPPELTQIGERRGSRRHSKGSRPSKDHGDEDGENSSKKNRLRRSEMARESTSGAGIASGSNLHMLRLGRQRKEEEGAGQSSAKMIQRKSTLEGARTISFEEQQPVYGMGGRGEARRRQRGLIQEPVRRFSKRASSKEMRRSSSKDAVGPA